MAENNSLRPHIELYSLKEGIFDNERIGKFIDACGNSQVLVLQTDNSRFTQEGLLEVKVYEIREREILIGAMNDCYIKPYSVRPGQVKFLDPNKLRYEN